jgi:hypothetical protein
MSADPEREQLDKEMPKKAKKVKNPINRGKKDSGDCFIGIRFYLFRQQDFFALTERK